MTETDTTPKDGLTTKQIVLLIYLAIAVGFAIYGTFFGELNYRGFFFNFGRSLVWPFILFPVMGKIVGSIVLVLFIIAVIALR